MVIYPVGKTSHITTSAEPNEWCQQKLGLGMTGTFMIPNGESCMKRAYSHSSSHAPGSNKAF